MKRSLILLTILLNLSLAVIGCGGEDSHAAQETTATVAETLPEDVQAVSTGLSGAAAASSPEASDAAQAIFSATGEFVSPVRSELSPKLPGRVAKLYVDEGAYVRAGQPVLELESDYTRLNLQSAQAEVARAKAGLDEAARDLQRKKDLVAKDSIPRATFDRSQATYDQAQAAHQSATAHAALLRQQLADATLRAPVTGMVAEKRTDVGARLGDAGVAFVFVQLSPLKLRFQVPERYLGRIERGDKVTATVDPYPNEKFEGTIKTVGGVIDPKTRTMFAEAEFANRDGRLRPGLFARVETKLD